MPSAPSLSKTLEDFVSRPLAFQCRAMEFKSRFAKVPPAPKHNYLAPIEHELGKPATKEELRFLKYLLGTHADPFRDLFARHNGFALYCEPKSKIIRDSQTKAIGVAIFSIRSWKRATNAMKKRIQPFAQRDPYNAILGIAFGKVPHSGNFSVILTNPPHAGKIAYTHDDGSYVTLFANSLGGFIKRVTTSPIKLLRKDFGGYFSLSDGTTIEKWLPEKAIHPKTH